MSGTFYTNIYERHAPANVVESQSYIIISFTHAKCVCVCLTASGGGGVGHRKGEVGTESIVRQWTATSFVLR